jgi:ribose 5-phosphate isomerase B
MRVALASDHAGLKLKEKVKEKLIKMDYEVIDFGTNSEESVDYPDFAYLAAKAVADKKAERGIVCCGTGIGVSIVANKVNNIRCALVSDLFSAKATREHNDSNMLALGERILDEKLAEEIVEIWMTTEFEGARHNKRLNKIIEIEELVKKEEIR